jgi:hypothetical protein
MRRLDGVVDKAAAVTGAFWMSEHEQPLLGEEQQYRSEACLVDTVGPLIGYMGCGPIKKMSDRKETGRTSA